MNVRIVTLWVSRMLSFSMRNFSTSWLTSRCSGADLSTMSCIFASFSRYEMFSSITWKRSYTAMRCADFEILMFVDMILFPVKGRVTAFALSQPRGEIGDDPLRNFLRCLFEEVQGCFLAQDAVGVAEVADAVVSAVLIENIKERQWSDLPCHFPVLYRIIVIFALFLEKLVDVVGFAYAGRSRHDQGIDEIRGYHPYHHLFQKIDLF